ncbi:MAG: glycosyltransferase [Blastocatellia bacterium]
MITASARRKSKSAAFRSNPEFHYRKPRKDASPRAELGLDPEKFTVFVNAGWIGGGNIPHIFEQMVDEGRQFENAQGIFLAGRNEELQKDAEELARRSRFPIKIIGYTDAMEKLMRAADVMVSKLGGLTTFEALASRLPIIADVTTTPMPQESQTAQLLARHKAGILLERAGDVVPIVRRLIANPAEHAALRFAAAKIAIPDATRRIVHEITQKLEPKTSDLPRASAIHAP